MSHLIPLANHLWQSTLVVGVAWLLTILLQRNHASVRHAIWLVASIKFLIPFSMLVAIGSAIELPSMPVVERIPVLSMLGYIAGPFKVAASTEVASETSGAKGTGVDVWILGALAGVWFAGAVAAGASWLAEWRRMRRILVNGQPVELGVPIRAVSCGEGIEPGVFGVFRPVLLLPDGVRQRLSPTQFRAILAHELCHVRRGDNLWAGIHMGVETLFWFHPLVWWIGRRLVAERERACDESVVRTLGEPRAYAEAILRIGKLYSESPACTAGVMGSNLKTRIEEIMTHRIVHKLGKGKAFLLAMAGIALVAGPVIAGIGRVSSEPARVLAAQDGVAANPDPETPERLRPVKVPAPPEAVQSGFQKVSGRVIPADGEAPASIACHGTDGVRELIDGAPTPDASAIVQGHCVANGTPRQLSPYGVPEPDATTGRFQRFLNRGLTPWLSIEAESEPSRPATSRELLEDFRAVLAAAFLNHD